MVSDVAAAIRLMQFNAFLPQQGFRRENVLLMPVPANRDHVRMFHEQKMIRAKPLLALRRDLMLYPERFAVAHAPQIAYDAITH